MASPTALEGGHDIGFAIDEDPRRDEDAARPELVAQARRERHQQPGDEIGKDDVEGRFAGRQAPLADAQSSGEPVAPGVGRGRLDGDRVGVDAERGRGAQLERGDGQDPRAAADVEDAGVRHAAPIGHRLERGEAQPGRRMEPGPERHPRIEREDDIVGGASMAAPRRPDDQSPADAHDREVRLPGVGPVGLLDDPRPELPDRAEPERLEMAERLGDLGHRAIGRDPVARRQIGAHGGRPGRIQPSAETLVHELERGLDRCPAGRHPAEDLADRLDRFDVGVDRQLEPGPRTAGAGLAQPSPSFSSRPPPPWATVSPASSA